MAKTGIHYIYYIDVTYEDGARERHKQVSSNGKNAIVTLSQKLKRKDIRAAVVRSKHPKTKHNREKALNYKQAQQERRKKEREDRIVKYDGLTRIE